MNETPPTPANVAEHADDPKVMAALRAVLAETDRAPEEEPASPGGLRAPSADSVPVASPAPIEAPPTVPAGAAEGEAPGLAAAPVEPGPVPAAAGPVVSSSQARLDDATPSAPVPVEHGVGVLLVNLGTPDAAEPKAVRRYLKEFLADPRVIENKSLLWKLVLNGIVLPLRSRRKARDYAAIWNKKNNESPFKTITRSQADKLAGVLEPLGPHVIVDWAMRYGSPSIASRLDVLIKRGCERLVIMPLYPQYSATTTATVCDEVYKYMMTLRHQPALRILPAYYEDLYYIEVLASSLKAELKALRFEPDVILASYHGMPRDYVAKGDPYEAQCVRTTELLRRQLGFDDKKLMMTFQSRFGFAKWLEPYTIKTVKALAKKGVKNIVLITPGFASDCLETLEEISVENARVFRRAGGQNFAHIPCLNDSEAGMLMIWQLAMRELKGWV